MVPYFYPNMRYSYLRSKPADFKRPSAWKRMSAKRGEDGIFDTFAYDKRQDAFDALMNGDEDVLEIDEDEDRRKKRPSLKKKKRTMG